MTGEELVPETVSEGIRIGLAETRVKRNNGRMLEKGMALNNEALLLSRIDVVVLIAQDEDGGEKNWESER